MSGNPFFCEYITSGKDPNHRFVVMELLGPSLYKLRRKQPKKSFSYKITGAIGRLMIASIESLHNMGFIHRDIKPSNFCIGDGPKSNRLFIIDFGLAKPYIDEDAAVKKQKQVGGFRGTTRYASINSHDCLSLSRRDDLWSLLYVLIEMTGKDLPWCHLIEREDVAECKRSYLNDELVANLPIQFKMFLTHLLELDFSTCPDYEYLKGLMKELSMIGESNSQTPNGSISGHLSEKNTNTSAILSDTESVLENQKNEFNSNSKNEMEHKTIELAQKDNHIKNNDIPENSQVVNKMLQKTNSCNEQNEQNSNSEIDMNSAIAKMNMSASSVSLTENQTGLTVNVSSASKFAYNPSLNLSSIGKANNIMAYRESHSPKAVKDPDTQVQSNADPTRFFLGDNDEDAKCCFLM
eukprot:TRINITY_DN3152_c0_g1_i1.p1 TRINITY_DN3152_c0_g1~~TRINITY_DN3152_c0_g1_i1.p1  ORF type:complete len:408 (-),score=101.42 TRINITY_DN3152_c0_g1_i1:142-1365(-)